MGVIGPATGAPAELRSAGGIEVLGWAALEAAGVDAVVTTRHGGVSAGPYASLNLGLHVGDDPEAVVENRRRAAASLGAGLDDLIVGDQVHGAGVTTVGASQRGRGARHPADALAGVDALVTAVTGPVLTVLVADCVPMVLVDPDARVLAAVHAGWRGTVAGVAREALAAMVRLGATPARVVAAIGPAVSPRTYEVGADVAEAVTHAMGDAAAQVLTPSGSGRWLLDLPIANRLQLQSAGVPGDSFLTTSASTATDLFFSHRAEAPCGRFALLARLRPEGMR